jgi:hypothetical protein
VWCVNFHRERVIYQGEWDLHRLGEVGLVPGGDRPAGWSGLHRLGSHVKYTPVVIMILTFGQLHFVIP